MAMKIAEAISEVLLVAGAGWHIGSAFKEFGKQKYEDEILLKVTKVHRELSKLEDEISGKAGNITSLIIPTVAIGALAFGIICFKEVILGEELDNRKRQIYNLNPHLKGLKPFLITRKRLGSRGDVGNMRKGRRKRQDTFYRGSILS